MTARTIEIVGGGLSGLSLGVALRRAGVPVVLHEAGDLSYLVYARLKIGVPAGAGGRVEVAKRRGEF